jgi:lysophospholipid acyltransferase (LPLAT)-like uncharacterized protein
MPSPVPKRKSGVVVPQTAAWHGRLAARVLYHGILALSSTLRFHWDDQSGIFTSNNKQPVIYCIWHNRLALCLIIYRCYILRQQPHRRMAAIVSASRDGGLLARVLELFGVQPVRGSSSRRGAQALLELSTWAERGYDLAITPDGPRGPKYVLQDGAAAIAQVTQMPVIPVAYYLSHKKTVNSWDRFQIPLPFSRVEVTLGKTMTIPPDATDAERSALRMELENRMKAITRD